MCLDTVPRRLSVFILSFIDVLWSSKIEAVYKQADHMLLLILFFFFKQQHETVSSFSFHWRICWLVIFIAINKYTKTVNRFPKYFCSLCCCSIVYISRQASNLFWRDIMEGVRRMGVLCNGSRLYFCYRCYSERMLVKPPIVLHQCILLNPMEIFLNSAKPFPSNILSISVTTQIP